MIAKKMSILISDMLMINTIMIAESGRFRTFQDYFREPTVWIRPRDSLKEYDVISIWSNYLYSMHLTFFAESLNLIDKVSIIDINI